MLERMSSWSFWARSYCADTPVRNQKRDESAHKEDAGKGPENAALKEDQNPVIPVALAAGSKNVTA